MNAYGIIRIFGVVVLLAAASVQCSKIHERMTDDEIANIFRTNRDNIPKYDVALVRHNRRKRWQVNLRMQFTAFGKEIDAYLHPSDGQLFGKNTPVWLASTMPNGTVEYKKMLEGIVGIVTSRFFISPRDLSTVVVTQTKGKNASFNGIVDDLTVRPLPKRLQEEARSRRNSEAPNASRTMLDSDYHVIFKSALVIEEKKIRHTMNNLPRLERQIRKASRSVNKTDSSTVKRSDREIIYPSVLVQTDYNVSKTTQDDPDHDEEILYQLAYWNAVDLRFRQVNNPKIRLRIAGIIIGQDRNATPYLQNYRSGGAVDLIRCFNKTREYWYNMTQREDFPEEAYNIVVTLTDTNMMYQGQDAGGIAAKSYCHENKSSHEFSGIAIIRDKGGFEGILTTTHELGHVFGLDHDEIFDDDKCNGVNGFLMRSSNKPSPQNIKWSPCSLRQFSNFLRLTYVNCYDRPADFYPPGDPVERLLPGDVWGPHKQCQARGYDGACDSRPGICTQLQCYHKSSQYFFWPGRRCENVGQAAEGTLCATGRKCVDGKCLCMSADCIYKN